MATFIGEERQKPKSTWGPLRGGRKLIPMHYAMALATIAGALSAAAVARVRPMSMLEGTSGIFVRPAADNLKETTIQSASATSGIEGMLDDLVALHKYPPVPETTNPEELQRFDLEVGVPVRRPAFQPFDGQFKGARLYMTRDARAALLQYTVKGWHRVTVYVFDPRVLPMRTAPGLDRRVVRDRPVYFGRRGGYSIAAAEQGGVGIALASDLDADDSARLALAAVPQSP